MDREIESGGFINRVLKYRDDGCDGAWPESPDIQDGELLNEEDRLEHIVEYGRAAYYSAWFRYIDEFDEDLFF